MVYVFIIRYVCLLAGCGDMKVKIILYTSLRLKSLIKIYDNTEQHSQLKIVHVGPDHVC